MSAQQKTKIGFSLVISLIILAACGQHVANHTGQTKVSASIKQMIPSSSSPSLYFELSSVKDYLASQGYKQIDNQAFQQDLANKSMKAKTYWLNDGTDKTQPLAKGIGAVIIFMTADQQFKMLAQFSEDQNANLKKHSWIIGDYNIDNQSLKNQTLINGLDSIFSENK